MAVTLFAAIDVGSYEVTMKVFQCAPHKDIKLIDHVRHRIELGKDTYTTGKIGVEKIEELCKVLNDYQKIMNSYKVDSFRVCATSALREASNRLLILEYAERKTGLKIDVLSNTERTFLDYKSIACVEKDFYKVIQSGTAIVDVGGGSVQICLFDNDKLVTTQNIRIGNLRVSEKVADFSRENIHVGAMVEELINNDVASFKKMYLKDREIRTLIIAGDYIMDLLKKSVVTAEEFRTLYERIAEKKPEDIAKQYGIHAEYASMILPSVTIYKRLIEEFGAQNIYLPGIDLADGIAYDYAQANRYIRSSHEFNDDIVAAARSIAKRYQCNKSHIRNLEGIALPIFDRMRKLSGMTDRDRLLLNIAVILHGCGKYISMSDSSECAYSIIMASEIIGLSRKERRIIANVVKYNTQEFTYEDILEQPQFNAGDFLLITKMVAILRVANALDRSHKQKFGKVSFTIKDKELLIMAETKEDITLEKGLFPPKADFFEEVFHIRPVIKRKKTL